MRSIKKNLKKATGLVFSLLISFPYYVAATSQAGGDGRAEGDAALLREGVREESGKLTLAEGFKRTVLIETFFTFAADLKDMEDYITKELDELEDKKDRLTHEMRDLEQQYDKAMRDAPAILGGGNRSSERPSEEEMTALMEMQVQLSVTGEDLYKLNQEITEWEHIIGKDQDVLRAAENLKSFMKKTGSYNGYWDFVENKVNGIKQIKEMEAFLDQEETLDPETKQRLQKILRRIKAGAIAGLSSISIESYVKETAAKALMQIYPSLQTYGLGLDLFE